MPNRTALKILIGLTQTTFSPFIAAFGYKLIATLNLGDALIFVSVLGSFSMLFNFIIGCIILYKAYDEKGLV